MRLVDVPKDRVRSVNGRGENLCGDYVLYWMTSARRTTDNFAFDRAVEIALRTDRPVLVLEALRLDYPHASSRMHAFVIQGMRDNARDLEGTKVRYYPYVERSVGEGKGLLARLAARAVAVVTDDFPSFFLPRMLAAADERIPVVLEAVDSNGLLPLRAPGRSFSRALDFRRHAQAILPEHLESFPQRSPARHPKLMAKADVPGDVASRWPRCSTEELADPQRFVSQLPVSNAVTRGGIEGGPKAATVRLDAFVRDVLPRYGVRADAAQRTTSGLSPYLHFGHLGAHTVFRKIAATEDWSPRRLGRANGRRLGYYGMEEPTETFLDELVVWRELGYGTAHHVSGYDRYDSLPDWAAKTLADHENDPRPHAYDFERFERAETHDEIWNAAQRELVRSGQLHPYLRMLWGKKILEWSSSPRDAVEIMTTLNDRYALDGRDPNSVSGIFWCLGRYDRPWGPERPIFGKIRYMSSDSTRRKMRLDGYLRRWAA